MSASSQSPSSKYYGIDVHGPNKRKALQNPVNGGSYSSFAPQAPQDAIKHTFRNGTTNSIPSLLPQQQIPFQNPSGYSVPAQSLPSHQQPISCMGMSTGLDPDLSEIMASTVPDGDEILEQLLNEASETSSEIMYYEPDRDHVTMSGNVTVSASNIVQNGGNNAGNQDVLEILSQFS